MTGRRAIVLADGGTPTRAGLDAAWPGWSDGVELVVAADGGARLAAGLGLRVDAWVGDGDSVDPEALDELRRAGVRIRRFPRDKDSSDTELALVEALGAGATDVTILGALGGPRLDHELANLALLATRPRPASRCACSTTGRASACSPGRCRPVARRAWTWPAGSATSCR